MSTPRKYDDTFYQFHLQGAITSAEAIIPIIQEYISPASVIDVGCGIGAWLKIWQEKGVKEITGVDGTYIDKKQLQIKEEYFQACNLENGYKSNKRYDLVTSLEVAEHLSEKSAEPFIESLCMLGDIILFSAAIPGQEGTMHINEQYPYYWVTIFSKKGYIPIDCIRQRIWNDKKIQWWYRQNILFFVKEGSLENYPKLKDAYNACGDKVLSLVHPEMLEEKNRKINYYEEILNSSKATLKYLLNNVFRKKNT